MRNPHAGQPFTTSDEDIAAALLDVSIPTLMLSLVHMSGDPELIRGRLKPEGLFLNEVQGYMTEDAKAEVRTLALEVIKDYRDRGCPEPEPISAELLHEMMSWLVVEDVPAEYVPMLMEEMELDGTDARRIAAPADVAAREAFPVVVIGCGQSGLLAGIRLQEAGIPFTIIEKNAGVGGTWWENSYPGARVDVGNHFYCYSFEPSDQWTEFFAQQPELQSYFENVMRKHGIERNVRWETEVLGAEWDDASSSWFVRVRAADGTEDTLVARALISAVGQLNRPSIPDIPGQGDFEGPSFHSARWDHDVDITGKKRRDDRCRSERLPDRADDRRGGRPPHGLPAHRAVDVPEPELSRDRGPGCAMGAEAPAVLRALVPLPHLLARAATRVSRRHGWTRTTPTRSGR